METTPSLSLSHTYYPLLAAIRGPDVVEIQEIPSRAPWSVIKRQITCRIREIVFGFAEATPLDLPKLAAAVAAVHSHPVWPHFRMHLWWAVEASRAHPIWEGHGGSILTILNEEQGQQ